MKNSFLTHYNLYTGLIWIVLLVALWMQFSSRAPILEAFLFALCIVSCAFVICTYITRVFTPKVLANNKWKTFVLQFIVATMVLSLLLALVTEGFYLLEKNAIFETSSLISDIHDPFLIGVLNMMPTSLMAMAGFCCIELFRVHTVLEKERLQDQLSFLRSQINPHLTFNVLNHIHILMRKNVELADELLLRFSDILRYQLYECNNELVLLESELKYIKDIVEIEKMRWGDELEVNTNWMVDNNMIPIRPLILISFIENAFKHVSRLPDKKGFVNIDFVQNKNSISLQVINSKSVISPRKNSNSGLGLVNTKKRLEILYSNSYKLDIKETENIYQIDLQINLV